MTERQGISFTLTMVVVGVILFVTAISVITLGGGAIQSFFGWADDQRGGSATDTEIQEACQQLVNNINNNYCNQYVGDQTSDCGNTPSRNPQNPDDKTPTELGCDWQSEWSEENNWNVNVSGGTYSCADEGYVLDSPKCPAELQ